MSTRSRPYHRLVKNCNELRRVSLICETLAGLLSNVLFLLRQNPRPILVTETRETEYAAVHSCFKNHRRKQFFIEAFEAPSVPIDNSYFSTICHVLCKKPNSSTCSGPGELRVSATTFSTHETATLSGLVLLLWRACGELVERVEGSPPLSPSTIRRCRVETFISFVLL